VTALEFPVPKRMGYAKFRNPASRYALCGVCVAELASGEIRVTVVGAGRERGCFAWARSSMHSRATSRPRP
jgi:carbon-monoxide dehydrogenase medium subunit